MKYNKEKIKGSKLNPKNWGVKDYTDKGDFNTAYSSARKAGEKEFMWNNKRFSTTMKNLPGERIRERDDFQGTIFTKPEKIGDNSKHGDLFNYYKGQPLVSETHNLQVSKYRPDNEINTNSKYISIQDDDFKDAIVYYANNYYKHTGKANRPSYSRKPDGGIDENLNSFKDLGNFKLKVIQDDRGEYVQYYDVWDYSRNNNPNVSKTDNLGQTKPFEVYDRIYVKDYGDGQKKRMYYSDKELSELDIDKKNFDTLALQRELSNRGYKLPKSTKEDNTFDGVWGDETKNALLEYKGKYTKGLSQYKIGGKLNNYTNINMKFNKEKTKKFASGGKTPQEIMEEARRNQAIERSQATNDVIRNSGIPAFQSQQVAINVPRPTVELTAPNITQRSDLKSMFKTRGEAFNYARKQGWNDFNWGGGRFHTKTAEEVNKVATPLSEEQLIRNATYDGGVLPEVEILGSRPGETTQQTNSTTVVSQNPPLEKRVKSEVENRGRNWSEVQAPDTTSYPESVPLKEFIKRPHQNFIKLYLGSYENRYKDNPTTGSRVFMNPASIWVARLYDRYYNTKSQHRSQNPRYYQQGGQLPSYQQGGVIDNIKNWVSSLLVDPNKYQVNESTYTTYKEKTPFIGFPKETRSIVGPNGQTSTMIIKNPNTSKADTTFISPGYTKDPDLYPKFTPQDIREGNSKGRGKESYLEKFTSPTYFPHIGKHQQGGTVDKKESSSTDQLYVDFAVRYLKAKGISEDNMVDNEGGLKDEFLEEVSTAISEVDSPDFWEQYKSNPDATVQSYVESKMEPEQIEMARKGAKLKKLKKGGMKSKKCKCGCDLIMKKEAGGTFVEVCACGCKNK